jgi:hypothetical protein
MIDRDQLGVALDALPPIFRDCVVTDEGLGEGRATYFCYPAVVGGHVYASDGRILIRTAATPDLADLMPEPPPGRRFPQHAGSMFDDPVGWDDAPTPLPPLDSLPRCRDCAGRGHFPANATCPACDGEEDRHCSHCGESATCDRCCGRGRIPAGTCVACLGSGLDTDDAGAVGVGAGITLGAYYLAILHRHGASLHLPRAARDVGRVMPVRFVVAGSPEVEGLLMPMTPPADPSRTGRREEVPA